MTTTTDRKPDDEAFKEAMRMLTSGVVVVTTEVEGRPWGLTVSAVCSISPLPPKLLVSLGRHTRTREAILVNGSFGVDVLRASQRELAEICASSKSEKWIDEYCERRATGGPPVIHNPLSHFDCVLDTVTEISDHSLVIGRVVATRVASDGEGADAKPLLYFDRAFREIGRTVESHSSPRYSQQSPT